MFSSLQQTKVTYALAGAFAMHKCNGLLQDDPGNLNAIRTPECKIFLLSGQATTANLLNNARANGHDFTLVIKPGHAADLLHAVLQFIRTRLRSQRAVNIHGVIRPRAF